MLEKSDAATVALRAALAGSAAIRRIQDGGDLAVTAKSASHDLVTAADRAAEAAVVSAIRAGYPEDALLTEESGSFDGTSGARWLIDPLDGTLNFVQGRADYAVSIAREVDGRLVTGTILRPADGRWLVGDGGQVFTGRAPVTIEPDGTLHDPDQEPVAIPEGPGDLADALVGFGMPYSKPGRQLVVSVIARLIPDLRGVRIIGSAACDLMAVALGALDAFVGFGLAEWDTAAGRALIANAGGELVDLDFPGVSERLPVLVAGGTATVALLVERLRQLGATPG